MSGRHRRAMVISAAVAVVFVVVKAESAFALLVVGRDHPRRPREVCELLGFDVGWGVADFVGRWGARACRRFGDQRFLAWLSARFVDGIEAPVFVWALSHLGAAHWEIVILRRH